MPERFITMGKFIEFSLVSRKELQHMLHSRRKAEIEVLSGIRLQGTGNPAVVQRLWLCNTTLILFPDNNIFQQNNGTNGKATSQGASRMISSIHQFTDRRFRNGIQSSWVVNPISDDQNQRLCGICLQLQDAELNQSGGIKCRLKTVFYISR